MGKDSTYEEVFGEVKDNILSGLDAIIEERDTAIEFMRSLRKKIRMMGIDIPEDPLGSNE